MKLGDRKYKAKILEAYLVGDMNGDGCAWSQRTVAAYAGCDVRTVGRDSRELEADGEITVKRPPRGSRACNVVRVRNRCPQLRKPTLKWLDQFRRDRKRRGICPPKRTTGVRALHAAGTPSSWRPFETNNGLNPHRISAPEAPEPGGKRVTEPGNVRHLHANETDTRVALLQQQNNELADELAQLHALLGRQLRREAQLKRRLEQMYEEDATSIDVKRCLTYWHRKLKKTDQTKLPLSGKRAEAVRQALRWKYELMQIKAVIDAGARYPFLVFGVRRRSGNASSRRDDLVDFLKDERSIETLLELGRPDVPVGRQMDVESG